MDRRDIEMDASFAMDPKALGNLGSEMIPRGSPPLGHPRDANTPCPHSMARFLSISILTAIIPWIIGEMGAHFAKDPGLLKRKRLCRTEQKKVTKHNGPLS